ncbi:unnamed protein product, partial [marine sediment metagenome]
VPDEVQIPSGVSCPFISSPILPLKGDLPA